MKSLEQIEIDTLTREIYWERKSWERERERWEREQERWEEERKRWKEREEKRELEEKERQERWDAQYNDRQRWLDEQELYWRERREQQEKQHRKTMKDNRIFNIALKTITITFVLAMAPLILNNLRMFFVILINAIQL